MRVSKRAVRYLLAALAFCLVPAPGDGQQTDAEPLQQVDLVEGGTLYGRVVDGGDPIRIVVGSDTIDLPAASVARIRNAPGQVVAGEYFRRDPNETRLFFGPTARTLPAGDAYLGIFELYLPFLAYGVTDRVTIAGGIPLIIGAGMPLVLYLAPKVQLASVQGVSAAVGSLSFFVDGESMGVVYGVMTAGAADGRASATVGGGWGYYSDDVTDRPVIMAGGDMQVSRSVKLLTENYFVPGEDFGIVSGGLRFIGENLSADVGLAMPSGGDIALPIVNFVWSF